MLKIVIRVQYCCLFFLFLIPNLSAQTDSIEEKIAEMLQLNGSKANFDMVINSLIDQELAAYSDLMSKEFYERFREGIMRDGYDSLEVKLIPVYKQIFTLEEIDGIITFLKSDVGQSMTKKTPIVLKESMRIGSEWGQQFASDISSKIKQSNELKFKTELDADCSSFREGAFFTYNPDSTITEVIRMDNIQIEKYGEEEFKFEIKWLSDCRYTLQSIGEKALKLMPEPLEINILNVEADKYQFIAKEIGADFYMEGEIIKIKSK